MIDCYLHKFSQGIQSLSASNHFAHRAKHNMAHSQDLIVLQSQKAHSNSRFFFDNDYLIEALVLGFGY